MLFKKREKTFRFINLGTFYCEFLELLFEILAA